MNTVDWSRSPKDMHRLMTWDDQALKDYYCGHPYYHNWDNIRRVRNKYKAIAKRIKTMERQPDPESKLGKLAELFERSGIDPSTIARVEGVSIYQQAMKNSDGEFETIDLYAARIKPEWDVEGYEPVEPARITPTKRKRTRTTPELILVYGDGQVDYRRIIDPVTEEQQLLPLHNVAAQNIIKQLNADFQPNTTVNLGDFADMSALSKFDPDSDHFHKTLGPSMRYIHDFYAQLTADNPDGHHVEVDSNHAVRIKKQVLRNLPAMHDYVRPGEDYPMMTYYYLANLGKLGIDFVSGYGGAEFVYGEGRGVPIVFKHGTHSSATPGATVKKESVENPEVNIVRGHGHSDEHISITTREGRRQFYYQLGSTCLNNGPVPARHSSINDHNMPVAYHNRKHQNTVAIVEDYGNGEYMVDIINIFKGMAHYRGKLYDGNTSK